MKAWFGAMVAAGDTASVVDFGFAGRQVGAVHLLYALALGAGAGALYGLPVAACFHVLRDRPRWVPPVFWVLAGVACGLLLSVALEAFARLDGRTAGLARMAIAGNLGVGLLLAGGALLVQPRPDRPRGWLGGRVRFPAVALTLVATGALVWADRHLYPGLYPDLHVAMRVGVVLVLATAIRLAFSPERLAWGAALALVPMLGPLDVTTADALLGAPLTGQGLGALRAVSDVDADGYSSLLGGGDCAAFDGAVHPGATEVPGNGLDDNCRLGDAAVFDTGQEDPPPPPAAPAPLSVLLLTLDTVRPDHLPSYGYARQTMPRLARFARSALRYDRAYTSGGWTSLAVPSLLRGVYPRRLTWTRVFETNRYRLLRSDQLDTLRRKERVRFLYSMPLDEPRAPLPVWLQRRGMRTVAVVDDGYSQFLGPAMGLGQGFDAYHLTDDLPKPRRNDRGTTDLALKALDAMPADQPFFLWTHFFGPHDPNSRRKGTKRWGKKIRDRYDHELRFLDRHLGRLLDRVEALAEQRPLAVVITSDHGELFFAKKRYHGIDLHERSIRVPLFVRAPGWPAGATDRVTSLVDVAPTVLGLTRTPQPYRMDGVDLGRPAPPDRVLLAETWRYKRTGGARRDMVAAFDGEEKFVFEQKKNRRRLVRQDDPDRPARNQLSERTRPDLEGAVFRYLEETGGPLRMQD